jgi:threonine dehydratase
VNVPTYADLEAAAARIAHVAHRTPVVTSSTVDALVGASVFFKCENFQRAGAFKIRGAYNTMAQLPLDQRRRGVIAYSSGNHAQAVALAGKLLDIPAVIVMPADAPAVKRDATVEYGAEVITYDRAKEKREALTHRLAEERRLALIPPFDHPHIIAGAGTAARELFEDAGALDVLLVPCGGGGLLSGSALAAETLAPTCRIVGVEPSAGDDGVQSFRTKTLQTVENPQTIADGARTSSLGSYTFPIILRLVSDMVAVDDSAILRATFFIWERLKLVVEPTGALGAAALFEHLIHTRGMKVGVLLSGGNADLRELAKIEPTETRHR